MRSFQRDGSVGRRGNAAERPLNSFLTSGERPFSIIGVYRHFDSKVARRLSSLRPDVVYAYEGGALKTFREAKRLGIRTIYEQASSYWYWVRQLLAQEAERSPTFAGLLPNLADSAAHLEWKDEELSLAETVFVASEHVRRTLAGAVSQEKIRVVHYGAPAVRQREQVVTDPARPLRVLFVGVLVQHKGIGYLLDAIDGLGSQVELTLVGRRFHANARVDEACRRWRWFETLSNDQVLDVMMESDVLVLPSLGEGFGLVVTEALACGLPVIVTPNVGASDLVRDGREGFVVPVCSADAIAERLQTLSRDRELLAAMSRRAQATAAGKILGELSRQFCRSIGGRRRVQVIRQNPMPQRNKVPLLKKLFWAYFLLLIFEGALRKWVVPGLSAPLLLVRDPIGLLIVLEAIRTNKWPQKWSAVTGVLAVGMLLLCGLQMIVVENPWIAAIYGLRSYLLPFPVAFVMGENLTAEDLRKFGLATLWILLPMTLLEVAQYMAAPGSWLNTGAYLGGGQIYYTEGHTRASGTFSFVAGPTNYVPLAAAFILYGLSREKFAPKWLLWAATGAVILSIPMIGARTVVFELIGVVACMGIAAFLGVSQLIKVFKMAIPVVAVFCLVSLIPVFTRAALSLTERFAAANRMEGGSSERAVESRAFLPVLESA